MKGAAKDTQLLRELAEFAGLTPAALAREAGVAATTINRPYSGTATTRLSQPTLDKLRSRFPQFHGWGDYLGPSDPSEAIDSAYTREQLGWLNLLCALDAPDRDIVLKLARRLNPSGKAGPPPTLHDPGTADFWSEKRKRSGR